MMGERMSEADPAGNPPTVLPRADESVGEMLESEHPPTVLPRADESVGELLVSEPLTPVCAPPVLGVDDEMEKLEERIRKASVEASPLRRNSSSGMAAILAQQKWLSQEMLLLKTPRETPRGTRASDTSRVNIPRMSSTDECDNSSSSAPQAATSTSASLESPAGLGATPDGAPGGPTVFLSARLVVCLLVAVAVASMRPVAALLVAAQLVLIACTAVGIESKEDRLRLIWIGLAFAGGYTCGGYLHAGGQQTDRLILPEGGAVLAVRIVVSTPKWNPPPSLRPARTYRPPYVSNRARRTSSAATRSAPRTSRCSAAMGG